MTRLVAPSAVQKFFFCLLRVLIGLEMFQPAFFALSPLIRYVKVNFAFFEKKIDSHF